MTTATKLPNSQSSGARHNGASALVAISGWGTAVPSFSVTQEEALRFVLERFNIRPATQSLYRRTFGNNAVRRRHFAVDNLSEILERDHERVNARFERAAVDLSTRSLQAALAKAGVPPERVDFLAVTTCTGYLCPGLSAYLVESAGLRPNVPCVDAVGMGCGAALPALRQARDFILAHPEAVAAVVCTELCSAAMFSNDAPDIVISNTIFADGSAAAVLRGSASEGTPQPRLLDFESLVIPEWRNTLRFRTEQGRLKNVLGKDVPQQAGGALGGVVSKLLARHGTAATEVSHWILHAGGEAILNAASAALHLPDPALNAARRILRDFGNMSSPTVLFVLDEEVRANPPAPGALGIVASFGAGFTVHAALVEF